MAVHTRVDLGGKSAVELEIHRGQVVGVRKWSETHVHSSGSRSWVGPQGGYVSSPSVSSSVRTRNEIWVRDHESGQEYPLSGNGEKFQYREGHEVAVIVGKVGARRETLEIFNMTTQMVNSVNGKAWSFAKDALGDGPNTGLPVAASLIGAVPAYFGVTHLVGRHPTFGDDVASVLGWAAAGAVFAVGLLGALYGRSREANRISAATTQLQNAMWKMRGEANVAAGMAKE